MLSADDLRAAVRIAEEAQALMPGTARVFAEVDAVRFGAMARELLAIRERAADEDGMNEVAKEHWGEKTLLPTLARFVAYGDGAQAQRLTPEQAASAEAAQQTIAAVPPDAPGAYPDNFRASDYRFCAGCTSPSCSTSVCQGLMRWQWKVRQLQELLQGWNPSNPRPELLLRSEAVPTPLKVMVQELWNAVGAAMKHVAAASDRLADPKAERPLPPERRYSEAEVQEAVEGMLLEFVKCSTLERYTELASLAVDRLRRLRGEDGAPQPTRKEADSCTRCGYPLSESRKPFCDHVVEVEES